MGISSNGDRRRIRHELFENTRREQLDDRERLWQGEPDCGQQDRRWSSAESPRELEDRQRHVKTSEGAKPPSQSSWGLCSRRSILS